MGLSSLAMRALELNMFREVRFSADFPDVYKLLNTPPSETNLNENSGFGVGNSTAQYKPAYLWVVKINDKPIILSTFDKPLWLATFWKMQYNDRRAAAVLFKRINGKRKGGVP